MSLPGSPSVIPFILSQGDKGGCFNICPYLAFPLSFHLSDRKVKRGVVLTYVSTWLSLCHSSHGKVRRGVVLTYVVKGGGFNICLHLALPLSFHLSYRKVRRGGVLTYVSTWLCLCHSIYLIAR